MRRKVFSRLLLMLILTVPSACDNVEWGGVEMELEPPSTLSRWSPDDGSRLGDAAPEPLDLGPVLYLVERRDNRYSALPVAELTGDGYRPLPDSSEVPDFEERFGAEALPPGAELVLFHQGQRAGTFIAGEAVAPDRTYCRARPVIEGDVELRSGEDGARALLALAKNEHRPFVHAPYGPLEEAAQERSSSVQVANRLLTGVGAPRPPSVPEIRRDLQVFPLGERGDRAFAASFVYGDELAIGEPSGLAYSLFYLAQEDPEAGGFEPVWYWYQREDDGGKAWPRFVGSIDWRETRTHDVVLRVFGRESVWFAVAGERRGAGWELLFQEPCATHGETGRTGVDL